MAVSGRKQKDMLGSIAAGSAEDFDNKCEPCLSIGQDKEANGFCVTCQEYLCKTCHDCHKKTKALRNHQIFGRDEFHRIQNTQKSNNECTEQCAIHSKETIKFYCPKHGILGCTDCMTIGHRSCKIDYIPEKCADIADGKEYQDIMMKLSKKLKEAEEVSKKAESSSGEIDNVNKEIIKKIAEFRAEINSRLDQMQHDVLQNGEDKKSINKEIGKKVNDACGNIISDVKKLQSNLRASKSNNQNGQLYIDLKRAESTLKSEVLAEQNEQLNNMSVQYSFRRSASLEKLLSKEVVFGEIINHPQPVSPKKKKIIDHLTIKNDVNVNTKSDKYECDITGCAILSSNKLVLADSKNKKMKVVSVDDRLIQEKVLDTRPFDIAIISKNQFAVTMQEAEIIDVMTIDNKLACVRRIEIDRTCYGIDCHQDRLYVACLYPSSVVVLTTQGNVLSNIPLNFLTGYTPSIAVRKDSNFLYISDCGNNSLVGVSLQGGVTATYKHEDLRGPRGICLLDDGSLLVCCRYNGTIHQVKDDLKEGKSVHKDLSKPMSICYSAHNDEAYVSCYVNNQLKVLSSK